MAQPADGAVIWDVDGTLVDTAELHYRSWVELSRRRQIPFSREDFTSTFGWRNPEILRKLFGTRFTDLEVAELGEQKEELYRAAARQGVDLVPGARPLLEGLEAAGFRQGVGSSAPRANLDLILEITRTRQFFGTVVAGEDCRRGKPDPQVFLLAAERLGVGPARCLVLEDAPVGVQAARAGGMRCIGVTFVGHHPAEALRDAGADLVVPSLEQVSVPAVRRILSA